jgi:23S rRNA pseudouridine1911/1915/1917 synthase
MYGFKVKREKVSRVYLHAYLLYLIHPHSGEKMQFVAPLFEDMELYLSKNFNQGDIDEKINPLTLDTRFSNL